MAFSPIAVVGQGCVLPGALTPEALWKLVRDGQSAITAAPDGEWRIAKGADRKRLAKEISSDAGGYVRGFDRVFDAKGFLVAADALAGLDEVFLWTLHAAREALRSAGAESLRTRENGVVVLGNLSYPTPALVSFALATWASAGSAKTSAIDPRNRFMSGLPAALVAEAVGFRGGALAASFAIDAACASSLYAIKLACDRLHDRTADIALAGGVNHADDLFLHLGFTALAALSPTGQSRPFHRHADGLVPGQGAAMVVLKRLDDAERDGDRVLGVIRGVGLSNDGRSRGLLVPSEEGQARAMRSAYSMSGIRPNEISLVECHATGTTVGDAAEVRSLRSVFEGARDVPLGSLKSNLGHLITASGTAALIKVLFAIAERVRPPTLHADQPLADLDHGPLRLLREAEPWPSEAPRLAAISNFGFGGNNAHLLVEEWVPSKKSAAVAVAAPRAILEEEMAIAVVAQAVTAGAITQTDEFVKALIAGRSLVNGVGGVDGEAAQAQAAEFEIEAAGLRFTPSDLKEALPQQTLLLRLALELGEVIAKLPRERTSLLVGMQCDAEVARCSLRWRRPGADGGRSTEAPLTAAIAVGCMPNIIANRLGHQLDLHAASFTVSAEEASGTVALDLALRSLRAGEIDAALVGAIDLSCEPVQRAADLATRPDSPRAPGDAAVLMVVKRLADARRDGDAILAVIGSRGEVAPGTTLRLSASEPGLSPLFGHAHAASGLLHVAAAVAATSRRALPPRAGRPAMPWLPSAGERRARVEVSALGGAITTTEIRSDLVSARGPSSTRLAVFAGASVDDLLGAIARGGSSDEGAFRVAIVAANDAELAARIARASSLLRTNVKPGRTATLDDGIFFGAGPMAGELAFVFTGPAGAYPHMGRDLALALPELVDALGARMSTLRDAAGWIYDEAPDYRATPTEKLWGSSFLIQLHAELTRTLLAIRPHASIGYCSGETNALFALGAWGDLDGFRRAIDERGVYTRELCGELACVRRAWKISDSEKVEWSAMRVRAPIEAVRAAVADEPRVHLTITNSSSDVVIAGDPIGCARVAARLGAHRVRGLDYDFVMHCPEARTYEAEWRALHHRPTKPVPGVRFYTHATLSSYAPTDDAAADALLGQAMSPVDFPALIERAYGDGVRLFIEHGPHAGCTKWIDEALGPREHLAVALDRYGRSSLLQSVESVARLVAAGVPMNHQALATRLAPAITKAEIASPTRRSLLVRLPAHLPPVRLASASQNGVQRMVPAPKLPPVSRAPVAAPSPDVSLSARADSDHSFDPPRAIAPPAPLAIKPVSPSMTHGSQLGQLAVHHANLAALHTAFLRQQAEAQAQFVRVMMAPLAFLPNQSLDEKRAPAPLAIAKTFAPMPAIAPPPIAPTLPPAANLVAAQHAPATAPVTAKSAVTAPMRREKVKPVSASPAKNPTGPRFDRAQLEVLSSGEISSVFGPIFQRQDGFRRQVRMPEPPLLLADRVLGIEGAPGEMGLGTIWTETDIKSDAWYLHEGRMPAGILVESGQADLLLISWLGVDFHNRGERVYRLLGCDLVAHGELPRPGDTLTYEIHVDGHARQGDVRLFFFHYDCRINGELRVTVRNGQAGFFTDEELSNSAGILWSPSEAKPTADARLDEPVVNCTKSQFTADELTAFIAGGARECFGPGFERAETHTLTPSIQGGNMRLLDEVTHFDRTGGPWQRGYLRARLALHEDHWFFRGHFKDDPCMPGTLMFEGCLQAMSIYLAALGYTLDRDGWRFEPVPDHDYHLRCRGQALPSSKEVIYEVFVDEIVGGPNPTLYADLLGTVDGRKAFHCKRMGLRLVPAWPLDENRLPVVIPNLDKIAACVDGFEFGYRSLLACAWGRPSEAFGEMYRRFDGTRRVARLPGPPYHFMSRVARVDGPIGGMKVGSSVDVEYDVPPDAWYFASNGARVMPYCVLLEAALQPCGWLASYIGSACTSEIDLVFRNLDGTGTVHRDVPDDIGTLVTSVKLKSLSTAGGLIIVGFDVAVRAGEALVYTFDTVFGFFTSDTMRHQTGLATTTEERARLTEVSSVNIELGSDGRRPAKLFEGTLRLPDEKLLMIDRVTGLWPGGGKAGLGRVRAEKDIEAGEWFFKAHFFQDPVQPGSLGLEAMLQALQVFMIERGLGDGIEQPRFEAIAVGQPMTWKYRGQVVPENRRVVADLDITEIVKDARGCIALAEGSLWVDGKRIYHAKGMGMRIVPASNARR